MGVQTSAGTVIAVSAGSPATYDSTGFGALTWTDISEIVNVGEFGKSFNLVTHNPIDNRRTVKKKGSYNNGQVPLQLGQDLTDAGQALLETASDSDADYAFKVTLQNGAIRYFVAQVMGFTDNVGGVDQIFGATCNLEITNDVVRVAAP